MLAGAASFCAGAPAVTTARAAEGAPISINATELTPLPDPSLAYNTMAQAMGLFAEAADLAEAMTPAASACEPANKLRITPSSRMIPISPELPCLNVGAQDIWGRHRGTPARH